MEDQLEEIEYHDTHFYLVMCRTRKKLDKYFKNNRIRNKQIIDIKKIIEEEGIDFTNNRSVSFFKVLIVSLHLQSDITFLPCNHRLAIIIFF